MVNNVVAKSLNQVIDVRLENHIVQSAIEDGDRHADVFNRDVRRRLLSIDGHIGISTIVKLAEVAAVINALAIEYKVTVARSTREVRDHDLSPFHVINLRE